MYGRQGLFLDTGKLTDPHAAFVVVGVGYAIVDIGIGMFQITELEKNGRDLLERGNLLVRRPDVGHCRQHEILEPVLFVAHTLVKFRKHPGVHGVSAGFIVCGIDNPRHHRNRFPGVLSGVEIAPAGEPAVVRIVWTYMPGRGLKQAVDHLGVHLHIALDAHVLVAVGGEEKHTVAIFEGECRRQRVWIYAPQTFVRLVE